MTTGHNLDNLYTTEDPILAQFQPFCVNNNNTGFHLSSWGDSSAPAPSKASTEDQTTEDETDSAADEDDLDDEEGDKSSNAAAAQGISPPTFRPVITTATTRSSSSRVRFSNQDPEVRCYPQADREDYGILFYSCHELQIMMDDARREEQKQTAATSSKNLNCAVAFLSLED